MNASLMGARGLQHVSEALALHEGQRDPWRLSVDERRRARRVLRPSPSRARWSRRVIFMRCRRTRLDPDAGAIRLSRSAERSRAIPLRQATRPVIEHADLIDRRWYRCSEDVAASAQDRHLRPLIERRDPCQSGVHAAPTVPTGRRRAEHLRRPAPSGARRRRHQVGQNEGCPASPRPRRRRRRTTTSSSTRADRARRDSSAPLGWVGFPSDEPDGDIHVSHRDAGVHSFRQAGSPRRRVA